MVFPRPALTFLAWIALAPLLYAISIALRARTAVFYGWLAGVFYFAGTLAWIRDVLTQYGGISALPALAIYGAFMAALALFGALFGGLAWLLFRLDRRSILFGIPALWVALELMRAHILTGFPWLLLGYSLADHLLIAQLARFGGVYLLSYILALFSTAVVLVIRSSNRAQGKWLGLGLFVIGLATAGGTLLPESKPAETAYLVQAQVPLDEEWTRDSFENLVSDLQTRLLATWARNDARSGLVVWPEMPAPLYYPDDHWLRERLHGLARQMQSPMVVSVVAYADASRKRAYNSAVLVDASGEFQGRYDKIHLVPFGEYIPLKSLFFFMEKITTEVSDFEPGGKAAPLGTGKPLGTLICYENIFPDLVRQFTAGGAQVLVNMSNDGWYGTSAARDQLLLMSRLRAIENGRWMLRSTNTGISAVVDPYGRVRSFPPDQRNVFPVAFSYARGRTVFVLFGHWFSWLCAAGAIWLVVMAARASRASTADTLE